MKSQLLKFIFVALFAGLIGIIGVGAASAQSTFRFEAPFRFNVGKDTLSAGKYELQKMTFTRYLLRNVESKESRIISFELRESPDALAESIRLTFNRYGETYFLRGIFERPDADGKQMMESTAERRLRKNAVGRERLAKGGVKPEKVSVELNN